MEAINRYKLDLLVITETWLKNTDEDQIWVQSSEINRNNLTIQTHNRTNKWGSGLALMHNRDTYMYESCTWKIKIGISTLSMLGVYHPPHTNNYKFTDDFMDNIMVELSQHENVVIAGDLNTHLDDPDSSETLLLKDMIEAIGLKQHVSEFTHNANHIIDLLITECTGLIKVMQCKVAEFISDHQLVYMDVNINKQNQKIKIRPTASITVEEFSKHFNSDKILESQSLSCAIDSFSTAVECGLDQIPPLMKVMSTRSNTQPWYDNDIKAQLHIM